MLLTREKKHEQDPRCTALNPRSALTRWRCTGCGQNTVRPETGRAANRIQDTRNIRDNQQIGLRISSRLAQVFSFHTRSFVLGFLLISPRSVDLHVVSAGYTFTYRLQQPPVANYEISLARITLCKLDRRHSCDGCVCLRAIDDIFCQSTALFLPGSCIRRRGSRYCGLCVHLLLFFV